MPNKVERKARISFGLVVHQEAIISKKLTVETYGTARDHEVPSSASQGKVQFQTIVLVLYALAVSVIIVAVSPRITVLSLCSRYLKMIIKSVTSCNRFWAMRSDSFPAKYFAMRQTRPLGLARSEAEASGA